MATCTVSGIMKDASETAVNGAIIRAYPTVPFFVGTVQIVPTELTTTTASNGTWSLVLSQSQSYVLTTEYPPNSLDSARKYKYVITTPASSTANFSTLATEL